MVQTQLGLIFSLHGLALQENSRASSIQVPVMRNLFFMGATYVFLKRYSQTFSNAGRLLPIRASVLHQYGRNQGLEHAEAVRIAQHPFGCPLRVGHHAEHVAVRIANAGDVLGSRRSGGRLYRERVTRDVAARADNLTLLPMNVSHTRKQRRD